MTLKNNVIYLKTLNERKYQKYLDFLKEENDKTYSNIYDGLSEDDKKNIRYEFSKTTKKFQDIIKEQCIKDFQNELIKQYKIKSFYTDKRVVIVMYCKDSEYSNKGERIIQNEFIRFIGSNIGNDNLSGGMAKITEINNFIDTTISVSETNQEDFIKKYT